MQYCHLTLDEMEYISRKVSAYSQNTVNLILSYALCSSWIYTYTFVSLLIQFLSSSEKAFIKCHKSSPTYPFYQITDGFKESLVLTFA
jgi:hypothetical protein